MVSVTPKLHFKPWERTHGTHCTGGWVGPRAGLDTEAGGKIRCPWRESNPDRPVVQPVVRHYTAWANLAPCQWWSSVCFMWTWGKWGHKSGSTCYGSMCRPLEIWVHLKVSGILSTKFPDFGVENTRTCLEQLAGPSPDHGQCCFGCWVC
jgi:hypothetical protein